MCAFPSGVTAVGGRAVKEATMEAGAREVYLIEEPMAAALGRSLPVSGTQRQHGCRRGGRNHRRGYYCPRRHSHAPRHSRGRRRKLDESITHYIKRKVQCDDRERTAENVKITIGSAMPEKEDKTMDIRGRDMVTGLPKTLKLTAKEINAAMVWTRSTIIFGSYKS